MSDNLTHVAPAARHPLPGWATAVVVLQSVTLLAVVASRPAAPAATAAQLGAARGQEDARQVLPNAGEQRAQQTRVLGQIHEELVKVNGKLDRVNDQLKAQQQAQPAAK